MHPKIKVLLVEDNEEERQFMKKGFMEEGHFDIIAEAASGDDILAYINGRQSELPDLVITDLNMPGRNGYEVILDFKSHQNVAHIPVIVLTSAPYMLYGKKCQEMGACAYFTKPDSFLEYEAFAGKVYRDIIPQCIQIN